MRHPDGRPQVVAHRGSSFTNPEHTLAAYVRALDEGADALECDVRLTSDGHLVCVHDRTLERVTGTRGSVVSTMRLDQLDELDFGSWKNPWADLDDEAPDMDVDAKKVLTMRRLLETVRDYDRTVDLAIETKHPTRYAGLVERSLVQLLDEFGWAGRGSPARVMSFSRRALTRVKKLAPDLEVVYLMYRQHALVLARELNGFDWIAGPGIELLRENPTGIRRLSRLGRRVHVWTVNTEQDIDLCLELGVEAVITDRPNMALAYLTGGAGDARRPGGATG